MHIVDRLPIKLPGLRLAILLLVSLSLLSSPQPCLAEEEEGEEWGGWSSMFRGWNFSGTEMFDYRYNSELFSVQLLP